MATILEVIQQLSRPQGVAGTPAPQPAPPLAPAPVRVPSLAEEQGLPVRPTGAAIGQLLQGMAGGVGDVATRGAANVGELIQASMTDRQGEVVTPRSENAPISIPNAPNLPSIQQADRAVFEALSGLPDLPELVDRAGAELSEIGTTITANDPLVAEIRRLMSDELPEAQTGEDVASAIATPAEAQRGQEAVNAERQRQAEQTAQAEAQAQANATIPVEQRTGEQLATATPEEIGVQLDGVVDADLAGRVESGAATPEDEQNFFEKLLTDDKTKDLILGIGMGLLQRKNLGDSLAMGVAMQQRSDAARAVGQRQAAIDVDEARERNARTRKLIAETQALSAKASGDQPLTDKDFNNGFNNILRTLIGEQPIGTEGTDRAKAQAADIILQTIPGDDRAEKLKSDAIVSMLRKADSLEDEDEAREQIQSLQDEFGTEAIQAAIREIRGQN